MTFLCISDHLFEILAGFLLCLAHFYSVHAEFHYHDFIIKETNFTKLCTTTMILTVNDTFPGPALRVRKGDTMYVNVHNQGDYGITIHWHGVKQPRNSWYDGPEYITQCPIAPTTNFTYEIIFSDEEGTLWWHAHSDWARATLHGVIVIEPAVGTIQPFPKPDAEEIIVLSGWYTEDLMATVAEDMVTGADLPDSDSYAINGEPGDFCSCSNETTYRWMVDYGKTYLIRLLNGAMNADLFFAIAEHNLTVVGMDAAYVKPIETSYVMIAPGHTLDILITMNQEPGQYYMATRKYISEASEAMGALDLSNTTAILQYKGNYSFSSSPVFPDSLPGYLDIGAASRFEDKFRSLASKEHPISVPTNVTTRMYIATSMNQMICPNSSCAELGGNRLGASLNNLSWENPSVDILQAYYRNISGYYTADFPNWPTVFYNFTDDIETDNVTITGQATRVKVLNYNESVELVFQGTNVMAGAVTHPMHLHGYSFYVVGTGDGNFDNETDPDSYNLVDPPAVNSFTVPKKGWLALRFVASNPGVWFLHCHLDRHLSWGMSMVFIVKNGDTPETSLRGPPAYMPPCNSSSSIWSKHYLNSVEEEMISQIS